MIKFLEHKALTVPYFLLFTLLSSFKFLYWFIAINSKEFHYLNGLLDILPNIIEPLVLYSFVFNKHIFNFKVLIAITCYGFVVRLSFLYNVFPDTLYTLAHDPLGRKIFVLLELVYIIYFLSLLTRYCITYDERAK